MKLGYKLLFSACVAANLIATSCVDDMKFGNFILDKAPGGTATIDTVFGSVVYTQQFLNSIMEDSIMDCLIKMIRLCLCLVVRIVVK